MAFPLTPTDLPAWHMPDVASWLGFRAARTQQMRAVEFPRLTLVQVVQGSKRVSLGGHRALASPHTLLLAPPGSRMDVENLPSASGFRSECLVLAPALVEGFARRHAALLDGPASVPTPCVPLSPGLQQAWRHCLACWGQPVDPRVFSHRLEELLLVLALDGHRAALRPPATLTVSEQVRRLLLNQPGAPWLADAVALRLHRSPATLRRQLAREGQAFNQLLRDCRLGQALMLLQTTAQPIAQIAGVCGYTCPSRFALAFRQRYGVSPSSLRATLPPARGDRHVKTQEA